MPIPMECPDGGRGGPRAGTRAPGYRVAGGGREAARMSEAGRPREPEKPARPASRPLPERAEIVVIGAGSSLLHRLPSGPERLPRRAPAGARAAHLRVDLARRGRRRAAPLQRQRHPSARVFGRSLREARRADRPGHGLGAQRFAPPRLHPRAPRGVRAQRDHRPFLRARLRDPVAGERPRSRAP